METNVLNIVCVYVCNAFWKLTSTMKLHSVGGKMHDNINLNMFGPKEALMQPITCKHT